MADNWSKKFWKPVRVKDRKPIETLLHARAYMLGMPPDLETKPEWQRVSEAVMAAAKDDEGTRAAWTALVEALAINGKLEIG
jgi:hypothetical protein